MVLLLAGCQLVYVDKLTKHKLIETYLCATIGVQDANFS
jgi:hypothetical protein